MFARTSSIVEVINYNVSRTGFSLIHRWIEGKRKEDVSVGYSG